jgi:hypothetical protein
MAKILHHMEQEEMHVDGTATCGSGFWLWASSSWENVTCPQCLAIKQLAEIVVEAACPHGTDAEEG